MNTLGKTILLLLGLIVLLSACCDNPEYKDGEIVHHKLGSTEMVIVKKSCTGACGDGWIYTLRYVEDETKDGKKILGNQQFCGSELLPIAKEEKKSFEKGSEYNPYGE